METLAKSLAAARRAKVRYVGSEDGAMTVFMMFVFLVMLLVGGMAVDFINFESKRSRLQSMLDRATLAAADLEQELEAEEVVRSFARSEGLEENLTSIVVTEQLNSRTVSASAEMMVDSIFLDMMGIDQMLAVADSEANEEILDLEIIMVLDISGSMAGTKIDNMQDAARDFVGELLGTATPGEITIGVVPFNGQVNLGPALAGRYNIQHLPYLPNVRCVDLPASAYSSPTISRTSPLMATGYVDTYSSTYRQWNYTSPSSYGPYSRNVWCQNDSDNHVVLPTSNLGALDNAIDDLEAVGATSINAGMRWGLELVNPASRTMFSQLISSGAMQSTMAGRPFDYGQPNTMKVIVLMTDGNHFAEERLNDAYRSGLSNIYLSNSDRLYSVYHDRPSTNNDYYYPHDGSWNNKPYPSVGGSQRLDWRTVWENLRMSYVAWELYARPLGSTWSQRYSIYDSTVAMFRSQTATSTMDTQLETICQTARTNRIIVFGISFEAPDEAAQMLSDCSYTPSHYYPSNRFDIGDTFVSISNQIKSLRLTQ
jgi:Flp pilus assembly protein TadG